MKHVHKNLFFITHLLGLVSTACATAMPEIRPKKNSAMISLCAKWTQEIQKSLDPLWIPEPVRHLIVEYMQARTWKLISETPIPPSTACAYIPISEHGPLLALSDPKTFNIRLVKHDDVTEVASLKGNSTEIEQLMYSAINRILISRAYDDIHLWSVDTNHVKKSRYLKTLPWDCETVALSPHEDAFAAAISSRDLSLIKIIPLPPDEQPREYSFPRYAIAAIGWHHDNKRLLIHGSSFSETGDDSGTETIIFDTQTGSRLRTFRYEESTSQEIAYLSRLNQIYCFTHMSKVPCKNSPYNSDLSMLSDDSGKQIKSMQLQHRPNTRRITRSPHDAFIALISKDSKFAIIDTDTHKIHTLSLPFSEIWDPIFFASDDCLIVPGHKSCFYSNFDIIRFVCYVPDEA